MTSMTIQSSRSTLIPSQRRILAATLRNLLLSSCWCALACGNGRKAHETQRTVQAAAGVLGSVIGREECAPPRRLSELALVDKVGNVWDSWGNELWVDCRSGKVLVVSAGPDGVPWNKDDIL